MQMAPPNPLTQFQMGQVRNIVAEEINNAFNELIPTVTADIIAEIRALIDERMTAMPGGTGAGAAPARDSAYYFAKFSKCNPPLWEGVPDPIAAKHWVSDVEGAFMTCGCPDQFKVIVAMNQLRKQAKDWWKTVTVLMTDDEVRAISWAQFVERFEAQYVPKVEQQRMLQEFMALEQTTESITELNAKFLQMLSFCPTFAGNESWLVSRYAATLRTEIREFVNMQEFTSLSAIMDTARRREIELQTQSKRKAGESSSKYGDAQKKQRHEGGRKYEYRPASGQEAKKPMTCFNCKRTGHHMKDCKAPPAKGAAQATPAPPVCYNCNETGHKRPECPKLKNWNSGGSSRPAGAASSSQGTSMVTRGRAHQLAATAEAPPVTATVAGILLP